MSATATLPETMRAEFIDGSVLAGSEAGFYRLELGGAISFDGCLDQERLRRALELLLVAEPILRYRFEADGRAPMWRRIEDVERFVLLTVRESAAPIDDAAAFVPQPFEPGAPLVAAVLLHGPSGDTLAVRIGHLAADGGALKQALYLLGEFYRRLAESPEWTPEPNVDGIRYPVLKAGLLERLRLLGKGQLDLTPKSDWKLHVLGGRGPASYVSAWVERDVFHEAVAMGKAAGATVGDVIMTAYYRSLFRALRPEPGSATPMMITIDLRKYLPTERKTALANISSASTLHFSPAGDESFDGTLARIAEITREWKRSDGGQAAVMGLMVAQKLFGTQGLKFFRKQFAKAEESETRERDTGALPVLTNIGLIAEDRLDFGPAPAITDAWLYAPAGPLGLALAASTYRERLHLSQGTEFAGMQEELIREVVEGTAHEIEAWVTARCE